MTDLTMTYKQLKALNPCPDDFRRVVKLLGDEKGWTKPVTAAEAVKAGATLDDIVWVASAIAHDNPDIERRLSLWGADCAAHVLHIYEKTETSDAPRNAIIAARQYARGEIDAAAWAAARAAAWAARDAAWAARDAGAAAWAARAARAAARDSRDAWAAWAARAAARDSRDAGAAARDAEKQWQLDRLVTWLSDDEPRVWPLPHKRKADK